MHLLRALYQNCMTTTHNLVTKTSLCYQPGPPVPLSYVNLLQYLKLDGGVLFQVVIQRRVFNENNGQRLGVS